jgi:NIPSNAP protein
VEFQLRVYSVKPGAMSAWVEEWRRNVAPLRRRFGFEVIGPWVIEAEEKFVWILAYDGEQGWEAADAAYYASEERRAVEPEPTRHLLATEHWLMRPV